MEKISFNNVLEKSDRLITYLDGKGIKINNSSVFSKLIQDARQVQKYYEENDVPLDCPAEEFVGSVANLWHLADAILGAIGSPLEQQFEKRLKSIAKGNPCQLSNEFLSDERVDIFELICAKICSHFGTNVEFGEPDVLSRYKNMTWGLACKSAFGTERTLAKAIRKGVKQIISSDVDCGIVVVQITNTFPHNAMYGRNPENGNIMTYKDRNMYVNHFQSLIVKEVNKIELERKKLFSLNPIDSGGKVRAILYLAQTIGTFEQMMVIMGGCYQVSLCKVKNHEDDFSKKFNHYLQNFS